MTTSKKKTSPNLYYFLLFLLKFLILYLKYKYEIPNERLTTITTTEQLVEVVFCLNLLMQDNGTIMHVHIHVTRWYMPGSFKLGRLYNRKKTM